MGTGEHSFFPVQLTTSRIGNLTRMIHTLLNVGTMHTKNVFVLFFVSCPSMAINVRVQHNGEFLTGIILLTRRYYHRGTRLKAMKRFCICSL